MPNLIKNKTILISGASIAGPALAYWLHHYGFTVTLVEQAPKFREGGYKVDARGICIDVLKKMGLYEKIQEKNVHTKTAIFMDDEGAITSEISADELGMRQPQDVELLRGDLSKILYDATRDECEYIFNTSIKSIKLNKDDVEVEFNNNMIRSFDLVIGADGIHSNVRSLVFGEESQYSHDFGNYFYAIYSIENYLKLANKELFYSIENKQVNLSSTQAENNITVIYLFQDKNYAYNYKEVDKQKAVVIKNYANAKWEVPHLLKEMDKANDFYFDVAKQIHMQQWFKDRVALIGDAAYSPALTSGQGSSVAIVGAYVLAGELYAAAGDYEKAFTSYQNKMQKYIKINQEIGEAVINFILPKPKNIFQQVYDKIKSVLLPKDYTIKQLRKKFYKASNGITLSQYE
ncbi:FAD-dependent oxidoreductase [Legionella qingyii]|uniref:FAD-dependent oxidoreductase n=1 Tax=Legionella qingyii TaxID=2184757 RepID=A0A317U870_9GAMM|nr:FAD-dependent monooxygenase [Legionella qingyii]PWY56722.1 FAD-dependent oxidoreductase [Legionella qingyii]RUR23723.1 FAD-dependent oxidoreductase [Legionella qingyii]RUR26305.1 FAD-dependent oxidoreductase [Legionella qingyii]